MKSRHVFRKRLSDYVIQKLKRLSDYIIYGNMKMYGDDRRIYGGDRRMYGGAGRNSLT